MDDVQGCLERQVAQRQQAGGVDLALGTRQKRAAWDDDPAKGTGKQSVNSVTFVTVAHGMPHKRSGITVGYRRQLPFS